MGKEWVHVWGNECIKTHRLDSLPAINSGSKWTCLSCLKYLVILSTWAFHCYTSENTNSVLQHYIRDILACFTELTCPEGVISC